jgi:hypothetical protein
MILNILTILKKLDDFSQLPGVDEEEIEKVRSFRANLVNIAL